MRSFTREDVLAYVATLAPEFQRLHTWATEFVRDAADTLDEEFQVAAAVKEVFTTRAREWWGARRT